MGYGIPVTYSEHYRCEADKKNDLEYGLHEESNLSLVVTFPVAADFLKTSLTDFVPDKLENHTSKGKGKEKKKARRKQARRRRGKRQWLHS